MNAVLIGCSDRKKPLGGLLPALDLYEGNCIPELRARLGVGSRYRSKVFVLSGLHGLLSADEMIESYDHRLSLEEGIAKRSYVGRILEEKVIAVLHPSEVIVLAEPPYFAMISNILVHASRPLIHWFPCPKAQWGEAADILDKWGWPR